MKQVKILCLKAFSHRTGPYVVGFFGNIASYVFCLLWVPTENSELWIIYLFHAGLGVCDSIWFFTTTGEHCFTLNNRTIFSWKTCSQNSKFPKKSYKAMGVNPAQKFDQL